MRSSVGALSQTCFRKVSVVRKHNDLRAVPRHYRNLVNGLASSKGILTAKRIVEHHRLGGKALVLRKVGQKDGEGERGAVTRTESVLEAGEISGRAAVAKVDRGIVDHESVS